MFIRSTSVYWNRRNILVYANVYSPTENTIFVIAVRAAFDICVPAVKTKSLSKTSRHDFHSSQLLFTVTYQCQPAKHLHRTLFCMYAAASVAFATPAVDI